MSLREESKRAQAAQLERKFRRDRTEHGQPAAGQELGDQLDPASQLSLLVESVQEEQIRQESNHQLDEPQSLRSERLRPTILPEQYAYV